MEYTSDKKVEFVISDKKKKDIFITIFNMYFDYTDRHRSEQYNNINFIIDKTSFYIPLYDTNKEMVYSLYLKDEWFDYYKVDKKYKLCINSEIFKNILNTKNDDLIFSFYLEKDNILTVELKKYNINNINININFEVTLLDFEDYLFNQHDNFGEVDYDAIISISSNILTNIYSQFNKYYKFGYITNIKCSENSLELSLYDDISYNKKLNISANINLEDITSYKVNKDILFTTRLCLINKLGITNKLTDNIELSIIDKYAMKIHYNLGDKSSFKIYLFDRDRLF